jgi:hypothetical protein
MGSPQLPCLFLSLSRVFLPISALASLALFALQRFFPPSISLPLLNTISTYIYTLCCSCRLWYGSICGLVFLTLSYTLYLNCPRRVCVHLCCAVFALIFPCPGPHVVTRRSGCTHRSLYRHYIAYFFLVLSSCSAATQPWACFAYFYFKFLIIFLFEAANSALVLVCVVRRAQHSRLSPGTRCASLLH